MARGCFIDFGFCEADRLRASQLGFQQRNRVSPLSRGTTHLETMLNQISEWKRLIPHVRRCQIGDVTALSARAHARIERGCRQSADQLPSPTFHGVAYDNMRDDPATATDEAHNFEPHFDRHVWVYRENPNGVFEPFNPGVSCAHHGAKPATAAP